MYRYKNLSLATKTFYGVTFKPGEEKDVPGFINDPKFVRVSKKFKPAITTEVVKKPNENKSKSKNIVTQGGKIDGADTDK